VLDDPAEQAQFTRFSISADGRRLGESAFQVSGITCAACTGIIESALYSVPGVTSARVSAASQRATVGWDPALTAPSALVEAIRQAGYEAVPDAAAPAREMRRQEHRTALWRVFVASFCAMQVMMFATPSYVAAPGDLTDDLRQLLNWGSWLVSLPVVVFSAWPFFTAAWRSLRQRRIGMDVPVALGVAVTFVASTGATFDPQGLFGHEVYFDSLTMFVSFLLAGRYLELRTRHRAANELEAALARMPDTALRLGDDGQWVEVSVQRLRAGDRVRVALGQAFPADGSSVGGATRADESLLTGESTPVDKPPGSELVGGSVNVGAPVEMRVERVGADTRFQAIVAMMRDAMTQRPASARLADRWAAPFLWAVLLLAGGAAVAWSFIDPSRAVWVAVSVLIVTCPCALSLAAPSALVAAAGGLARRGVMLQRLDALETLATSRTLFIDKTGTLTEDQLQLSALHVQPAWDGSAAALQDQSASLAGWSTHPLSAALARTHSAAPAAAWHDVQETAGRGLMGTDEAGRVWRLGSAEWVGATDDGRTRVWVSREGQVLAGFEFDEFLRPGAAEAVQGLKALGWRITLLSGDTPGRAQRMAERLGLDAWIGAASPEDKLAAIAAAQAAGQRVVMVGDGVNDAPVLARADVSLAMGQGALVSRAQADAVITSNRPAGLLLAHQVAARTVAIVRQNMWWAAAYNASCIPLALVGWLPPWAAGLGMAVSSLVVVGNAMRAAR